ncbi:MAG: aminotransferase class III-fold pyridoxal phosphate-dependent enzyme, partial [Deltaproteobacteria bacterium]|nr:aminotransferase class III-fold pyridoxal phosphate-dependent enzyme [Deltaproteobacteria bacterium]
GAYGGRRDLMEKVAPLGPVYQAGTLSGNPLAMTAGIETLSLLREPNFYEQLEAKTKALVHGIHATLERKQIPHQINAIGSMWTVFFAPDPVTDFASASRCNRDRFRRFFHAMLKAGIYLPPSPFEAAFVSAAHTEDDIHTTINAIHEWCQHE